MRLTITLLLMLLAQAFLSAETNAQTQTPACPSITVRDLYGDNDSERVCEGYLTFTVNVADHVSTDKPTFNWTTSAGKIVRGQGTATITVEPDGRFFSRELTAEVEVIGVSGLSSQCSKRASRKVIITECMCPTLDISCPTDMREPGESVTIYANISGGRNLKPKYKWQVSAGKIISGQGTPAITVATTELAGQNVTATVEIDGFPPECNKLRSCTLIPIESIPSARKFDEYSNVSWISEETRLTNFAVQLGYDPSSQGYVIVYGTRRIKQHLARVRKFLIEKRDIDPERLTLINGGRNKKIKVELWIGPPGAEPPKPNSNF